MRPAYQDDFGNICLHYCAANVKVVAMESGQNWVSLYEMGRYGA